MINAGRLATAAQIAARCANSELFREGYESYIAGKPFDYDKSVAALYERGRVFAIYSMQNKCPRAVWRKGVLAKTAELRVIQCLQAGYMR